MPPPDSADISLETPIQYNHSRGDKFSAFTKQVTTKLSWGRYFGCRTQSMGNISNLIFKKNRYHIQRMKYNSDGYDKRTMDQVHAHHQSVDPVEC